MIRNPRTKGMSASTGNRGKESPTRRTLDAWVNHINVSVPRDQMVSSDEVASALKKPIEALNEGGRITHALKALLLETEEVSLLQMALEGDIEWSDLDKTAAQVLPEHDEKRIWIHDAAIARRAVPAS